MAEIQQLLNNLELNGGTPDEWRIVQAKIAAFMRQYETGRTLIARYLALPEPYDVPDGADALQRALDQEATAYLAAVI